MLRCQHIIQESRDILRVREDDGLTTIAESPQSPSSEMKEIKSLKERIQAISRKHFALAVTDQLPTGLLLSIFVFFFLDIQRLGVLNVFDG